MSRPSQLLQELKRRRVFRVAVVYAAVAFVIWQAADFALPALRVPDWVPTLVVVLTLLGFPIAVVLAWAFEITPEGVKRTEAVGEGAAAPAGRGSIIAVAAGAALLVAVVAVAWILLSDRAPEDTASAEQQGSLLVLPFENLGPPEDGYFADGVTDAITVRLAALDGLGVFSRQTAYTFKGSNLTAREIGAELGADYILEGTVQRERPGDPTSRVRVIPQLIRVADDQHLWGDTYDEEVIEVFRVQSEIAERVARELDVTLLEPERRSSRASPTDDLEAYESYLRGREAWGQMFWDRRLLSSADLFGRAVELDPEFALAQTALSQALVAIYFRGRSDDPSRAAAALDAAVRLEPDLVETQMAQGYYEYYATLNAERALERFDAVLRSQPNNCDALGMSGVILTRLGKWEEGIARIERAAELDPRNQVRVGSLGIAYTGMRRHREAGRVWDRMIALNDSNPTFYTVKAQNYLLWEGNREQARRVLEQASNTVGIDPAWIISFSRLLIRVLGEEYADALDRLTLEVQRDTIDYYQAKAEFSSRTGRPQLAAVYHDSARAVLEVAVSRGATAFGRLGDDLALAYAGLGRKDEAVQTIESAVEMAPIYMGADRGVSLADDLAEIYVRVGEYEAAIDQLEYLLSVPSIITIPLLRVDPLYDPLRDHPRFQALLEREP
ncbi:MAG: tetratricopeptide repeat protein [Gemmatimonadota bacterium]|nr:MAG: tetratricopeptide repeat protein [Gemmatimonadota bacterium]